MWEIPIPGFVGSGKAAKVAEKEGGLAAFIKGIITTILAVPCSGPGIAVALSWCTGKPLAMVYLVFVMMGLGMALPYIVIGLNPSLVKFLPKPGTWMETFKQLMGFCLLGTTVWLLWTMQFEMVLPTVAFLFVLWLACWIIGNIPLVATRAQRVRGWGTALAVAGLLGWFCLGWFGDVVEHKFNRRVNRELANVGNQLVEEDHNNPYRLDWQPFTFQRLEDELAAGNTVMVDFTADW